MKHVMKAAALAALFAAGQAHASPMQQFDFTYTFTSGDVFTGSFFGTVDGTDTNVTNISNVTAFFDGTALLADSSTGYLDVSAWNSTTQTWDDSVTAVVSFNAANNNFLFADADVANSGIPSNYFYFINDATQGQQAFAVNTNVLDAGGNAQSAYDMPATGSWSLAAVPVPGAMPLLLSGLGVVAAAARRRVKV